MNHFEIGTPVRDPWNHKFRGTVFRKPSVNFPSYDILLPSNKIETWSVSQVEFDPNGSCIDWIRTPGTIEVANPPDDTQWVLLRSSVVDGIIERNKERATYSLSVPDFCELNSELVVKKNVSPGMWARIRGDVGSNFWVNNWTIGGKLHMYGLSGGSIYECFRSSDGVLPGKPWSDKEAINKLENHLGSKVE